MLLLMHGWPTSSIEWYEVASQLSAGFRVCALDFPGYGFSDKPHGWGYSLRRDEELIEFYLAEVIGAEAGVVVAHDRGDSVALLHASRCAEGRSATRIEHLFLSNGNIFLPLSNLTRAQRQLLDAQSGPQIAASLTAELLAEGLAATTLTPPRKAGDPEVEALTAAIAPPRVASYVRTVRSPTGRHLSSTIAGRSRPAPCRGSSRQPRAGPGQQ